MKPILPLGYETQWGAIKAIHSRDGERIYFCVDKKGVVTMIPSECVEGAEK